MKKEILNKHLVSPNDIDYIKEKARAIIINSEGKILITEYSGMFLFPGGKKNGEETSSETLLREIKEELGITYTEEDLIPFMRLYHYQKKYEEELDYDNRLVISDYFIINSDLMPNDNTNLSDKEKAFGFKAYFTTSDDIKDRIKDNNSSNPRKFFLEEETLHVLDCYYNK